MKYVFYLIQTHGHASNDPYSMTHKHTDIRFVSIHIINTPTVPKYCTLSDNAHVLDLESV